MSRLWPGVSAIRSRPNAPGRAWFVHLVRTGLPLLAGQALSLLYYRRQCRAWDTVAPGLLIGRKLSDAEAAEAVRQGVTAVLDLTAEFSESTPFLTTHYHNLPVLDLTAPTLDQLREAASFITEHCHKGVVYVHCKIGYSRSAAGVHDSNSPNSVIGVRSLRESVFVLGSSPRRDWRWHCRPQWMKGETS